MTELIVVLAVVVLLLLPVLFGYDSRDRRTGSGTPWW